MPLGCLIVVFITQSITSEKMSGDKIKHCLTPVLTVKGADISVVDDSAAGILIDTLDDVDDLLMDAIVSQDYPGHCSVRHVKRLFEVNKYDIQRRLSF